MYMAERQGNVHLHMPACLSANDVRMEYWTLSDYTYVFVCLRTFECLITINFRRESVCQKYIFFIYFDWECGWNDKWHKWKIRSPHIHKCIPKTTAEHYFDHFKFSIISIEYETAPHAYLLLAYLKRKPKFLAYFDKKISILFESVENAADFFFIIRSLHQCISYIPS